MAHIYRLIFGALLFLVGVASHASFPATPGGSGYIYSSAPNSTCEASKAAACSAVGGSLTTACFVGGTGYGFSFCTMSTCPSGSTKTASNTCTCSSGFDQINNACVPSCPNGRDPITNQCKTCPDGQKEYTTDTDAGPVTGCQSQSSCSSKSGKVVGTVEKESLTQPATSYACSGGCTTKVSYGFGMKYTDGTGVDHQVWVGDAIGTGGQCSTETSDGSTPQKPAPVDSTTNSNSPKTAQCPVGQMKQTINGVSVCSAPGAGDTTTTSNSTSSTASDGTKTTTTSKTTCTGDKCTTTTETTTQPPTGTPTTETTSKDQNKQTFCQENPGLSICKEGSFNGSCGAEPACTGDALACATASASFKSACALNPASSSESQLYDSEKVKIGSVTGDLPGNSTSVISSSSFNQTEQFSGGGLRRASR